MCPEKMSLIYLVFCLVPGLELGLLELEPESLDDCLRLETAADLGNVAHVGDPSRETTSRVRLR